MKHTGCDCGGDFRWLSENERRLVIVFCPLHAAAPAMLEALKRFTETCADGAGFCVHCNAINGDDPQSPHSEDCPILQARAVTAKVEEE